MTDKPRIGIVVAQFNDSITSVMKEIAVGEAADNDMEVISVHEVPGSFEIPFAVQKLLAQNEVDGVVTLGAVIKGHTDHDVVIVTSITSKLLDLQAIYDKPVSLGIIGPGATHEQAVSRQKEYAQRAVQAVRDLILLGKKK